MDNRHYLVHIQGGELPDVSLDSADALLFIWEVFAEGDCEDVFGVIAFNEVIHGFDSSVNAVVAKLTGNEADSFCAGVVFLDESFSVESSCEDLSVIWVHTACTVDDELVENAGGGAGGSGEVFVSHHVEGVPCKVGKDDKGVSAENSVDKEAHSTGRTLSPENIGSLLHSFMLFAEIEIVGFWHGAGVQIALDPVAVAASEEAQLFFGLDTLSDGFHIESVSKGENALQHDTFLFVLAVMAEEGLVNLEHVSGNILYELEGRETAAEIVDSHLESGVADRDYPFQECLLVANHSGFGYFNLQQRVG